MEDYYNILGINRTATDDEIKKAYRKLAIESHPDKHPGDKAAEERFKKINEAYATLSDKKMRQEYDMHSSNPFANGGNGQFRSTFSTNFSDADIGNIFNQFFAGSHFRDRRTRYEEEENVNIRLSITVSFEEAYIGAKKTITYNVRESCPTCGGDGYDKKSKFIKCPNCNGNGYTMSVEETFFGQRERKKVRCPHCNGRGNRHEKPCKACGGKGVGIRQKTVNIAVPAGAYNGMELRAAGQGSTSRTGKVGDLYIVVNVAGYSRDGVFSREQGEGQNMRTKMKVSYYELICGGEREIKLPNGEVKKFKIPAGVKADSVIKLKGLGFKYVNGAIGDTATGDLLIEMDLDIPKNLTEEQQELLKKFDESIRR